MEKLDPSMAQQIAQAASAFEQQRTGHAPQSVTVVLSDNTLVITLHGALSPAEKAWPKARPAPPRCRSFTGSCSSTPPTRCGRRSRRITGVEVREATAEVEPTTGTVVQVFTTGTVVQVYLLAQRRDRGQLERERTRRVITKNGGFAMLVLSRKNQESVVVGGSDGFHRLLKVTVLGIRGANVKLGFEVDDDVPVHRSEVWERIRRGRSGRRTIG